MATLYLVATPIGNLKDITLRALDVLRDVDLIVAEDTRVTRKLLDAYEITTRTRAFHHHSNSAPILEMLREGKSLALVSDAGTPGVNDPGGKLIADVLDAGLEVQIVPIPGASALTALISVAGIAMERFEYRGFVPHKKGRQTFVGEIVASQIPVIFFESTHRIMKTLEAIAVLDPDKKLVVGRELTKLHESIYRGTVSDVIAQLNVTSTKGEFVILAH